MRLTKKLWKNLETELPTPSLKSALGATSHFLHFLPAGNRFPAGCNKHFLPAGNRFPAGCNEVTIQKTLDFLLPSGLF